MKNNLVLYTFNSHEKIIFICLKNSKYFVENFKQFYSMRNFEPDVNTNTQVLHNLV
jgi:hypothetical protein